MTYMFKTKGAALSTIKGYRAMLAAVFKFPLPEISSSPILKDLVRSFEISAPRPIFPPPPWDLDKVLEFLSGPPFEPLARASFLDKTKKALFLLAMATAKRVSELQALSFSVSFQGEDLVLYYDPFFRAKTESVINPLPRSVVVPSLSDFAGNWFPDLLELLSDVPITLSDRRDLLRQPHFHRFHQNLPMLRLTAWRLSSGSPSKPVSLLRWLDNLSSVEDCPPT